MSSEYRSSRVARRISGPIFASACLLATTCGVVVISIVIGAVLGSALQGDEPTWSFLKRLILNVNSIDPEIAGFRAGVLGSLWLLGIVIVCAIPAGVGAAVYLEELTPPGWFRSLIQANVANLAGVPSIVYGILGQALFVRAFGLRSIALGPTVIAGGLTLGLVVLPVIVIATQEALRCVPRSLREAAIALGATRWEVLRDQVLPAAIPGIMTGAILAVSRAAGETAPLLMVGAAASIGAGPRGLLGRFTALPVEIYNHAKEADPRFAIVASGGILILLAMLLLLNGAAVWVRNAAGVGERA